MGRVKIAFVSKMSTGENVSSSSGKVCKVIIIGAGMAGISAAVHLSRKGEKDIRILESRNRTGGRIVSIKLGGFHVELGAKWIHGVMGNPIYELALKNGLVQMDLEQENHTLVATTEDGKRVPIKVVEEVYSAYFWFCKRCEEYFLLRLHPPDSANNSVGKHLEMDITLYLNDYIGEDRHIRRLIFDHLLNRETCITGCSSMNETGLADFGSYTELPGGNINVPDNFSGIIDCLVPELPENCILKEHTVTKIYWKHEDNEAKSSDSVNLDNGDDTQYSDVPDKQCQVHCSNGEILYARHVIVTLPLGILKEKAREMFHPPLPDYKLDCINRLCFGVVNKIYLEYDRPFLNPNVSEIVTLWNRVDPDAELASNWFRKIYSFSKISENVLLAWVSGQEAVFVESLSEEDIAETCTKVLRKFLCDPYIPRPCRVVRTTWGKNEHTRGSYTSIGVNGTHRDIELLGNPIYLDPYHNKPVLLFAGEATHSSFYSTVHGAFFSGLRVAELLIENEEENVQSGVADLSSWLKGIDLN